MILTVEFFLTFESSKLWNIYIKKELYKSIYIYVYYNNVHRTVNDIFFIFQSFSPMLYLLTHHDI